MSTHKKRMLLGYFNREKILKKLNSKAVSEVIGTILLLSISLALLCVIYIVVLNNATSPSSSFYTSSSQLLATADEKKVYLQNNGGEDIALNTKLIITVGGQQFFATVGDCLVDTNGDGKWSIGEQLAFTPPAIPSLFGLEILIKIINPDSNNMIMAGLVQEGARGDLPYIQTLNPVDVWPHSATLKSYYSFVKAGYLPGKLWFQWKRTDEPSWNQTISINITAAPFQGFYQYTIYNLTSKKQYLCEAWIEYTSGGFTYNQSGGIKIFTTQIDAMGIWHFDELTGVKVLDSSGQYPPNDGFLKPNDISGPQRIAGKLNHSAENLYIDGIDDTVQVPNSNTISVTDECTIETWINRSEHSDGLIGTPLQSSLSQFGNYTLGCVDPYLVNVTGNIKALVSTNENSYGFLSTINITGAGDIIQNESTSSCVVDLFMFDNSCRTPKVILVNAASGIVAIVYSKPSLGNQLYLKTIQIFSDGRINKTTINTRVLDVTLSSTPDIIHINNDVYAVVYSITPANTGVLLSVNISNTGVISPVNNKLPFVDIMIEPEIIKIVASVDNYVIVYNCIGDDGGIRTVKITTTGVISDISFHVWFDDDDGGNPEIIYVKNDVYAIVYAGPVLRQSVILKTIEILPDGTITLSRLIPPLAGAIKQKTIDFIANMTVRSPHIVPCFGINNFFAISYSIDSGTSNLWGRVTTIMIMNTGVIVALSQKDCIFEPYMCSASYLFPIKKANMTEGIYGIVYRSEYNDGIIKTLTIGIDGHFRKDPILDLGEIGGLKTYAVDELLTSDNQYVINVYRGINAQLWVKTVKANTATKTIANTFTDSLVIELGYTSSNGTYNASFSPTIIPIKNDVYAIAYCHYMNLPSYHHGRIITIKIDPAGQITPIERYLFDTDVMNNPFVFTPINKTNNFYAVVYQMYSTSQGKIATIKIGDDGHIFGVKDSWVFEPVRCREPSMVSVSGDVYAIMYRDSTTPSNYGRLATLKIYGNNGTIKKTLIDLWQFTTSCYHPSLVKVNTNIFASAFDYYDGGAWRYIAYVVSVKIANTGIISKTWIDSLEFIRRYYTDNYMCHQSEIFHVDNRVYAIISKDLPDPWNNYVYNGWVTTLRIGENGDIVDVVDGATQISTSPRITSYDIQITPFVNDSYIALYGGKNYDMYQCVIRIPLTGTNRTIFSKSGSYVVQANKTKVFVTFTDSNSISYTLSANLVNKWNYIVSTYDKTTMNLYVNNILAGSLALGSKPIKVTANNLYFGSYNSYCDEFSLYAAVLSPAKITQNYFYYRPP
jgi:hypothetical protein